MGWQELKFLDNINTSRYPLIPPDTPWYPMIPLDTSLAFITKTFFFKANLGGAINMNKGKANVRKAP